VSVPDGGTILLGGLKTLGQFERGIGVPIANKVPFLNRVFANRAYVRDESTLLLMISPKIHIRREREEQVFPPQGQETAIRDSDPGLLTSGH
jgi:general secretion pathway protein D